MTPTAAEAPPSRSRARLAWRVVSVRFRFLLVLAAATFVAAEWDLIRAYWDRLVHASGEAKLMAVSGDTEYFCPMDPGVLSDWPSKCPVCNMALVRRKRGDATPLPDGVVARMQFSPYRLQLAGIQTAPVSYRALSLAVEGTGTARPEHDVEVDVLGREALLLSEGQAAEVEELAAIDRAARAATVQRVEPKDDAAIPSATVRLRLAAGQSLRPGAKVSARVQVPMDGIDPFRAQPSEPPPLRPGEPRQVHVCHEHPQVIRVIPANCPVDGAALMPRDLTPRQRVGWWCPMHPEVAADRPGRTCEECGGMALVPRVLSFRPRGQVLAVPESAVVDTGARTVVYVERMPGLFDGVEVRLGPRCDDAFPVIAGLDDGQRVATAGAFLIDAETRLNPGAAASYFGSGRREPSAGAPAVARPGPGLPAADRNLIAHQKVCPVTNKPLGSMGPPVKQFVQGRTVFLCCDGCEEALRAAPAKYLAKLPPAAGQSPTKPAP